MKISIEDIIIRENRRVVNPKKVKSLADSIKEVGLINPVVLTKDHVLVAGAHRIEAYKLLAINDIAYTILEHTDELRTELAEIDENLIRNELHWTEQDDALARRKAIYEELYPMTKHGGDRKSAEISSVHNAHLIKSSFVSDTSEKIGVDGSTIRRSIQRSTDIAPEVKTKLKELDLTKTEGTLIARLDTDTQKSVIEAKIRKPELTIKDAYKELKTEAKREKLEAKKQENKQLDQAEIKYQPIVFIESYKTFLPSQNGFDLLLTDPPFSTDIDDIESFVNDWLPLALDTLKDSARGYICIGAYPREIKAYIDFFMANDRFTLDNPLIWTYRNTLGITPNRKYNLNYQMILHFYSSSSCDLDKSVTNEMFSVQDINAPDGRQGDRYHRWQKPNELARRLITHSTKEGDRIIDPFAGSGTFLVNAGKLNRYAVGCDTDATLTTLLKERGCNVEI